MPGVGHVAAGPGIEGARGHAFGREAGHRRIAVGPRIEKSGQSRIRVAEQRHADFVRCRRRHPEQRPQPPLRGGVAPERIARREEAALADESAGSGREAGEPEAARQRQPRMRRRESVRAVDPSFRAQVFEDEPRRRGGGTRHRRDVGFGKAAAKGFDDDVGRWRWRKGFRPAPHRHACRLLELARRIDGRRDPREGGKVILPQRHVLRVLGHELPRETPADAGVAVVVDDPAENVPAAGCGHEGLAARRACHYRAPVHAATGIMTTHEHAGPFQGRIPECAARR